MDNNLRLQGRVHATIVALLLAYDEKKKERMKETREGLGH
jgi:hypothetical protein